MGMILALGNTPESEFKDKVHHLSNRIAGSCGLLFTNTSKEEVLKYFNELQEKHFARSGFIATEKYSLPAGQLQNCPPQMEPRLRKLGLQTKLNKGIVELIEDTIVCKKGDRLSAQQCQILELFEQEMAVFKIDILAMWKKGSKNEPSVYEDIIEPKQKEDKEDKKDMNDDMDDDSPIEWCAPEDMASKGLIADMFD